MLILSIKVKKKQSFVSLFMKQVTLGHQKPSFHQLGRNLLKSDLVLKVKVLLFALNANCHVFLVEAVKLKKRLRIK